MKKKLNPLGKIVAHMRGLAGETQERFARRLGVGLLTVSHWECGKRIPQGTHLHYLAALARKLGLKDDAAILEMEIKETVPLPLPGEITDRHLSEIIELLRDIRAAVANPTPVATVAAAEVKRVLEALPKIFREAVKDLPAILRQTIASGMEQAFRRHLTPLPDAICQAVRAGAEAAVRQVEGCNMDRQVRTERHIYAVREAVDELRAAVEDRLKDAVNGKAAP